MNMKTMTISRSDISGAFDDLLSGARTRKVLADWASSLLRAEDAGELKLEPAAERDILWDAVKYLVGMDLQQSPNVYLDSADDFRHFRQKHGF